MINNALMMILIKMMMILKIKINKKRRRRFKSLFRKIKIKRSDGTIN